MELELKDKLALVTGSTAGIGYAIAQALAAEGARVIINGRTQEAVTAALGKPDLPGQRALGYAGDLADAQIAAALVRKYPHIDILVNNLGIFETKPFEDIPDEDWRRFFEVNVLSGVRMARLVLPGMKRRNWGRIVFVSSESALQIPLEMVHYGMTKAAQIAVARGLAESLAGTRITVNTILPGPTRSRGVADFIGSMAQSSGKTPAQVEQDFFRDVRPTSLIKRFIEPPEVGSLVAWLASPRASATTGAALRVDGGVVRSAF